MDADGLLAGLDEDQRQAVTATTHPLCILAGAGSGKTRVLTRRIAHRSLMGDADPRKVLALTFTRKAAGELSERLAKLGLRDRPTAGTFHAIAYQQLRTMWAGANQRPPVLLERKGSTLAKLLGRGSLMTPADLAGEIEWAKARLVSPTRYPEAARAADRRVAADPERVATLYNAYEEEKRARGAVDFDDLLLRCLSAMSTDTTFAAAQRWRHRHVFVDEFQDVNPLQFRLLQAWLGDSTDLCVVGDPAQAIYGWNGADAEHLVRFTEHFPGAEVVQLRSNYRSTPEILTVGARVLGSAAGIDRAAPIARRPPGPELTLDAFDSDTEEAAGIARALRDHHAPGTSWSRQAVLVRTNGQLAVIEQALRRANIPHRVRGGQTFAERPEIRDALRAVRNTSGPFSVWLSDLEAAVSATREQLGATAADAEAEAPIASSALERVGALEQLIRLGHEFHTLDPIAPAHAFAQWLTATVRGDDGQDGDAVQLATFHAAKGLEWSVVHLAGLELGLVPIAHAKDASSVAEERRLLYVAVTRAEDAVCATWAASRTFGTKTVERQPSPWLNLLRDPNVAPRSSGRARASGGAAAAHTTASGTRTGLRDSRRRLADAVDHRPSQHRTGDDPQRRAAFDALWAWRAAQARKADIPPAVVLPDRVVDALARERPTSAAELAAVAGVTALRVQRYGDTLLAVLAKASERGPGGAT